MTREHAVRARVPSTRLLERQEATWKSSFPQDARVTRFGIALAKDPTTQYGVYWAMVVAAEPPPGSGAPLQPQ